MKQFYQCLGVAISCGVGFIACAGADSTELLESDEAIADEGVEDAFRTFTAYTSEEFPPIECNANRLVDGFDCDGGYCDLVSLDCESVSGFSFGESGFGPFISEETQGGSTGAGDFICDSNEWMTGIDCNGGYCDNVSIECTTVSNKVKSSCQWSAFISEENAAFQAPAGRFVDGVDCAGDYCDRMRFRHCIPL